MSAGVAPVIRAYGRSPGTISMDTRFLRTLLWLASAAAAVAFVVVVIRRFVDPIAPTPVETALLDFAQRLVEQRPLYVEPLVAAPPALMPGFPVLVALLAQVLGLHLWEPRFISVVATVLTAGVVTAIVRAETQSWTFAAAGGGLVLAGCGLIVGHPELARPEMLMLLLVLAGFAAVRYTFGIPGALLAALLLTAACAIHPMAVCFTVAALLYIAIEDSRRFVVSLLAVAMLWGAGYFALSLLLGPWFNFFAWDLPLHSLRFEPARLLHFLGTQLLGQLGVLTLAAVFSFALPTRPWRGNHGLWMFMGFAMLGAGLLATQGPLLQAELLVPGVVVLALLGPISMERVTRHLAAWPGSSREEGQGVALAALALQFLMFSAAVPAAFTSSAASAQNPPVSAPSVSVAVATPEAPSDTASPGH
jgi:hypothetical protein